MKHELTNLECLLVMALCLMGVVFVNGCATEQNSRTVQVKSFILVCAPQSYIAKLTHNPNQVGFYSPMVNLMYVPWSGDVTTNGDPLPDFAALGHEVWHVVAGKWHKEI